MLNKQGHFSKITIINVFQSWFVALYFFWFQNNSETNKIFKAFGNICTYYVDYAAFLIHYNKINVNNKRSLM